MKLSDIPHADTAGIDSFAWHAIKTWPEAAGFNPMHDGLDFGELVRWFLWSKVGRAIRAQLDPEAFKFEKNLFLQKDIYRPARRKMCYSQYLGALTPFFLISSLKNKVASLVPVKSNETKWADEQISGINPSIYIPHPSARLEKWAAALIKKGYPIIISDPTSLIGYSGAQCCPRVKALNIDHTFAKQLYKAILKGLSRQGVSLLSFDTKFLYEQINAQLWHVEKATAELILSTPKALLMHGDNHSPYQEYVAVAKRCGIPTITFQHGLDCERYYLDDAYASSLAVWSGQRKQRYEKDSSSRPALLEVTGNPAFDSTTSLPKKINLDGDFVLWITRPHTSSFCYSPSRQPREGLDIFDALLDAMAKNSQVQLVVKPHPQDYAFLYESRIIERNLSDRIKVVSGDLQTLIGKAKIVISEDSTGGLEAMLQGKILIHSHFAESAPDLPFCQYEAALPGFTKDMIADSLSRAGHLSQLEQDGMLAGQHRFIHDFAGHLDGRAERRIITLCETFLANDFIGDMLSSDH